MSNVIKITEHSCTGCHYRHNPRTCSHPDRQGSECNNTRTIYVLALTSRANDPATSKGKRKVNKYEQAVLTELTGFLTYGRTGKEIAAATDHPLNCITPRFAPLRRKGLIKDSGIKRDKQIVWVLA